MSMLPEGVKEACINFIAPKITRRKILYVPLQWFSQYFTSSDILCSLIWILNIQITWSRCVAYSPLLIPLHALPHPQLHFHTVATTSAFFLPQIRPHRLIFLQYTTHAKLLYGFILLTVWGYLKVIRAQSREERNAEYQMLYSRAMVVLFPRTFLTGAIQVQG